MVNLTLKQLRKAAVWWSKKLRIEDWKITVLSVHNNDMEAVANSTTTSSRGEAVIRISPVWSRGPKDRDEYDLEIDLVHELLHIKFDAVSRLCDTKDLDPEIYTMVMERNIETLAQMLVELRRSRVLTLFPWEKKRA
jgi:hypothetical protein